MAAEGRVTIAREGGPDETQAETLAETERLAARREKDREEYRLKIARSVDGYERQPIHFMALEWPRRK